MIQSESLGEIQVISRGITKLANHNTQVLSMNKSSPETVPLDKITPFDSCSIPQLTLERFFTRLQEKIPDSQVGVNFAAVLMVAYAERVSAIKDFCLTAYNVHRFFLATLVVAHKTYSDDCYLNSYFAKIGGIGLDELNSLELCLLNWLDFNTFITPSEFFEYKKFISTIDSYALMKYAVKIVSVTQANVIEHSLRKEAKTAVRTVRMCRTSSLSPILERGAIGDVEAQQHVVHA